MGSTDKTWSVQEVVSKGVFMISVFILATAARGEWLLCIVYVGKDYFKGFMDTTPDRLNSSDPSRGLLEGLGLKDLHIHVFFAVLVSFSTFWGIGLSFDTYFYKNRRHVF